MYYKTYYDSPIGKLLLVSNEEHIVGLWMIGQKYYLEALQEEPLLNEDVNVLQEAKQWLHRYFNLQKPAIEELPLAFHGSPFRQKVWQILCEIPYGTVITYGDIAKQIAKEHGKTRMSAQAVGNAVGHNPISIIVPCHRVVGANGSLTGYAGGLDKKIYLLEMENVAMCNLFSPKKGTAL